MESGERMEAELKLLELDSIDDHPSNPRLVYRDDVIDAIASCMDGEYPQRYRTGQSWMVASEIPELGRPTLTGSLNARECACFSKERERTLP
jgi:hypothetical protein